MKLPNLLVAGAQKAGTTWLHQVLDQHPKVFMSKTKELEFFTQCTPRTRKDVKRYAKHFASAGKAPIRGESTPGYFWSKNHHQDWLYKVSRRRREHDIPNAVKKVLGPDVRIVISLRDPVERAVSAYSHHVKRGRLDWDERIISVGARYGIVHMGFYYSHLLPWLQTFDRANLHVVAFESLMQQKEEEFLRLQKFLGLKRMKLPQLGQKRVHPGPLRARRDEGVFMVRPDETERLVVTNEELRRLTELYWDEVEKLATILDENPARHWPRFQGAGASTS